MAGTGAAMLVPARASALVGTVAPAGLLTEVAALAAVEQGEGPLLIHVLASPGCDESARMWDAVQSRLPRLRCRWIPFAGEARADGPTVAHVLDVGTPDSLRDALSGRRFAGLPSAVAEEIGRQQDARIKGVVARLCWEATARPLAAPSTVYRAAGGPVLVRGSIGPTALDDVLSAAVPEPAL